MGEFNDFGFIITRHVNSDTTNNYWNQCIRCLRKFYPHVYAKSYFESYGEYPNEEIINGLVDQYINQSFALFKTLAPNRVTSSQAFTFAKYCFYFKNGFSVSESYLTRIIEQNFSNKYIYKFQPSYGDGYIQKILSK